MDLPDCPPGAEGYQDSVYEAPKKPEENVETCTKAEQEFQEHLNSLKIKLEDGTTRCMVERRGRDISGKWIYRCYPCAAVCSGEAILQNHISGKKHKAKLGVRTVWPNKIFDEHPFTTPNKGDTTNVPEKVMQQIAAEVELHNVDSNDLEEKYKKFKNVRCHIQETIDKITIPLLGIEYLIEHPPEQPHHEPSYICTLCDKQGHPRTIPNHLTCFWHRCNYLRRHFPKASELIAPYRAEVQYRNAVRIIMNRLASRIEDNYGRMKPLYIDKEDYEREKDNIRKWISRSFHFNEKQGNTFEEVVDIGLIESLVDKKGMHPSKSDTRDPSPPNVAAPSKPHFNTFTRSTGRQHRRAGSAGSLSDISDEVETRRPDTGRHAVIKHKEEHKIRYEPYPRREPSPLRSKSNKNSTSDKVKPPNYEYKLKLAKDKVENIRSSMKKTFEYHEKNPEKHPLYPEEWKKFWNRRYKEIQNEGKDPSKHNFKPEWIVFWTARMKELHDQELRGQVLDIYRLLCVSPPDMLTRMDDKQPDASPKRKSPVWKTRSPEPKRRSAERKRSPVSRRRSPVTKRSQPRRGSPEPRRRSPEPRRRSPEPRRRSPEPRRRSPEPRRRSPGPRRRSPNLRPISPARRNIRSEQDTSPVWHTQPRRSPPRLSRPRSRSPLKRNRSPARTNFVVESLRRSRSPLSLREAEMRNRSPVHSNAAHASPRLPPSHQTVLISDDELKPDDLSPWNSDNDIDSVGSLPERRSVSGSVASRSSKARQQSVAPLELGPPENVVATLRLLVALEDYLGSLGPKVVDLLTQAIKMEKEEANTSEELLEREDALVLIETAKEKLKGAVQAGLVPHSASSAVKAAVVRAAATLHEADNRIRKKKLEQPTVAKKAEAVPVAGVGEVDRAQIAQQMAEALIAQGKTDVSAEELAQLVEAVVGMAEAKKRDAHNKNPTRPTEKPTSQKITGTASALQMLQSAYNENDKKIEKEDAPDAMDGLSDSDLETLLKNFNELSAEEQHSLIAFLKKLEMKEPARVERLRQYVSEAATQRPEEEAKAAPALAPTAAPAARPIAVESDDDDYTVEEVFKSATQKVKENQIRQEMEIVKKSLEESNTTPAVSEPKVVPSINLTQSFSSASGLLALLQTSMQSTSNKTNLPAEDVVSTSSQPRSFGDQSEPLIPFTDPHKPAQNSGPISSTFSSQNSQQGGLLPPPNLNQSNFGGSNIHNNYNQGWNNMPINNINGPPNDNRMSTPYGDNPIGNNIPYEDNRMGGNNMPPYGNNRMGDNVPYADNRMSDNAPYGDNRMGDMDQYSDNRIGDSTPMGDNRGQMQNRPSLLQAPRYDNYNQNQYNQGPRGNFNSGNNFDQRPDSNYQYPQNNYGNQNHFRGRGGRGQRGRGRGGYY